MAYAGRDATDVFATFHASLTWSKLKQYYVCDVEVGCLRSAVVGTCPLDMFGHH